MISIFVLLSFLSLSRALSDTITQECCAGADFRTALTTTAGGKVVYAIGTPLANTLRTVTTSGGESVQLFDFSVDSILNKPSASGFVPIGTATVVMPMSGPCQTAALPFEWGQKFMLRLDEAVKYDLSDRSALQVPADDPLKVDELPAEAPACQVADNVWGGKCVLQDDCKAPYVKYPWYKRRENGVNDGCRSFKAEVLCCSLPKTFLPPDRPLAVQERVFQFHSVCETATRSMCIKPDVATGAIDDKPDEDTCPNAGIENQRCQDKQGNPGRCSGTCSETESDMWVARTGCCDKLPNNVRCCLDKAFPPPPPTVTSSAPCFDENESRAVVDEVPRMGGDKPVIDDLPVPVRPCSCKNGGTCNAGGLCVCPPPFIGKTCEQEDKTKPADKEFPTFVQGEAIVPGYQGNDIWTIGGSRTIEFQVKDWSPSQRTKTARVWLYNQMTSGFCNMAYLTEQPETAPLSPARVAFAIHVGDVDLSTFAPSGLAADRAADFAVTVEYELKGDDQCIVPNHFWHVYIESVEDMFDGGPTAVGPAFKVEYAGCVSTDGRVGRCMSADSCGKRVADRFGPMSSLWTSAEIAHGKCGVSASCCVPTHTEDDGSPLFSWFYFSTPYSGHAPYYAHSEIEVRWKHKSGNKWGFCGISDQADFELLLFNNDDVMVRNYGKFATNAKVAKVSLALGDDSELKAFAPGRGYYFMARYNEHDGCTYSSSAFSVESPGCQANPFETTAGQCVTAGSCIEDGNAEGASACQGLVGNVECCKPKRGKFSAGFRGGMAVLDNSATAMAGTTMAVLVMAMHVL